MGRLSRIWARLRDPNTPGRQVIGVLGPRGEFDPERVFEMYETVEVKSSMDKTRYEQISERLESLRAAHKELVEERQRVEQEEVEALTEGRPVPVNNRDYDREISRLEQAIEATEKQLQDPQVVLEWIEAQEAALAQERQRLDAELAPLRQEVARLQAELKAAESNLAAAQTRQQARREAIAREERELRIRRHAVEMELEAPPTVNPERVAELLNDLRSGKIRSWIRGQDPDLDAAVATFEDEVKQLREWKSRPRLVSGFFGETDLTTAPACAQFYSEERIRELTRTLTTFTSGPEVHTFL